MSASPSSASLRVAGPGNEELPDDALLQRMQTGDRDAFAALTTRYWPAVHRIASNMSDESRAGPIAEEAFLQALRAPGWFPPDSPFHVSLYRLAIVLSLIQRRPGPALRAESLLPQFDARGRLVVPDDDGDELAARRDLAERLREGLDHVDELDRAAFVLRAIEEVSLDDAAAILRTTPRAIRDGAHRACLLLTGFLRRLSSRPAVAARPSGT